MQIEPKGAIDCARIEVAVHCCRCLQQQRYKLGARVRWHTHAHAVVCKVEGFAVRLAERYPKPVRGKQCLPVRRGLVAAVAGIAQLFECVDEGSCGKVVRRNVVYHGEAAVFSQAAHTFAYKLIRGCKVVCSQPAGDRVKAGAGKWKLRCVVQRKFCCVRAMLMQKTARRPQHWESNICRNHLRARAAKRECSVAAARCKIEQAVRSARSHPVAQVIQALPRGMRGAGNVICSVRTELRLHK